MPQRTRVTRSRSELDSVGLDGISGKKGRAYTYSEEPTPLKSDFRRRTRAATQSLSSASPTLYDHHSRRWTESGRGIGRMGGAWEGSASPTSTISSSSLSSLATASVDPFNLVTFFPTPTQMQMRSEEGSALFGGGEWDWLSEESGVNNKQEYERESEYESNDGSSNMNMGGLFIDIESSDKIRQVGLTDVAGQVIDGEDKFGMLGLTSGKIARILTEDIGKLLGKLSVSRDDGEVLDREFEPEDMEEVCWRYRQRRAKEEERRS